MENETAKIGRALLKAGSGGQFSVCAYSLCVRIQTARPRVVRRAAIAVGASTRLAHSHDSRDDDATRYGSRAARDARPRGGDECRRLSLAKATGC